MGAKTCPLFCRWCAVQPCENAELYSCRVCLRNYCLAVPPVPVVGADWPVYCDIGHVPSQLVPADMAVSDCVRVLRVGLCTPGVMGNKTWSVLDPVGAIRADS